MFITTTDTDGDGITDIVEFENGSDPTSSTSDADVDGVPDATEMAGDNQIGGAADGNGDGIPDHLQAEVAGTPVVSDVVVNNSLYQTVEVTAGDCRVIDDAQGLTETSVQSDAGLEFPLGLIDYTLACGSVGATSTVRVYYSEERTDVASWTFQKHNGSSYSTVAGVTTGTATIGGNTRTYFEFDVTDGGTLDTDGVANGVIEDPIGPSIVVVTSSGGGGGGGGGSSKSKIETNSVHSVDSDSVELNGEINDKDDWTVWFSISEDDETPSCVNPETKIEVSGIYDEDDKFTAIVDGLETEKTYYARACGTYGGSSTKAGDTVEFEISVSDGTDPGISSTLFAQLVAALTAQINALLGESGEEEVAVPVIETGPSCQATFTNDIALGRNNDPNQVRSLQALLNEQEGESLDLDGTYDQDDYQAVRRLQAKYSEQVLAVWGLSAPTGYVGLTTRLKLNALSCAEQTTQCPAFTEYNTRRENNNTSEVGRTQSVLKDLGFYTGVINNQYDEATYQSMIAFQDRFSATMLEPWGLVSGTGYKYKTTNRFLNYLVGCEVPPETLENGTVVSY